MKTNINNNKEIKIASINGAEILKIKEGRDGEIKYNCVFPNSILLDKLKELGLEITKNNVTKDIICLKFNYKYVSADGETIVKKEDIRKKLYNEGFNLDIYRTVKGEKRFIKTINYVFWFRSPAKCKSGECLFINKELFTKIDEWQRMGIELVPDDNGYVKLVEMEAYKSLVSSHLEGYTEPINPHTDILVVYDLNSYSNKEEVVKIEKDYATGNSVALHIKEQCKNTLWDGMSLIESKDEGFKVLRQHFFKTNAFCTNIQQFFKDYYKEDYDNAYIEDRYGRKVKVSNIKLITTENSMKWEKFLGNTKEAYENWCSYVVADGSKFGITKLPHTSKYGEWQRMSYQMIQTLEIDNIEELFSITKDYVDKLKNDTEFFIEHLKRTASNVNNNELLVAIYNKNKDFKNSPLFKDARKRAIYDYKETLKKGKILTAGDNETVCGNPYLLLEYAVGELTPYIEEGNILKDYVDKTLPYSNACFCGKFIDGEEIGAFRNPHNSMNNILLFKNYYSEEIKKYFNFGNNVIAVNLINNSSQERGNGFDMDGDFFLCTNTPVVVEGCRKAQKYPTIINGFKPSTKKYKNTMDDLAELDSVLARSQRAIGTSSNVAMLYLSQYWNSKDESLLDNVCILSVLAQCAVDGCKRAYDVGKNGLNNEIERIRYGLPVSNKPVFWQYTSDIIKRDNIEKQLKNKNKEEWKKLTDKQKKLAIDNRIKEIKETLINFNCPMDNILKEIEKLPRANYTKRTKDIDYIVMHGDKKSQDRKQATRVETLIKELDTAIRFIKSEEIEGKEEDCYFIMLYEEYITRLKGLSIKQETMSLIIYKTLNEDSKYSNIKSRMLNMLYRYNSKKFLDCFK